MLKTIRRWRWWGISFGALVIVLAGYSAVILSLPLPKPELTMNVKTDVIDTGKATAVRWPEEGSAALGADGFGVLASHSSGEALPTASMAKVILAMAVLRKMPIAPNNTGPTITLADKDVGYYNFEVARDGSVVRVASGEKLTEYQALEGLLLPSGNNMAATLADWAFGGEVEYMDYANAMLKNMGLSKTYVSDASGYSPVTVSTPNELVLIGIEAMKNPVFRQIVSQKTAVIPVAGTLVNTNFALGHQDINGIKTGRTASAGDCLLFSATRKVYGQDITVVGAIQGMSGNGATYSAPALVEDAYKNFVNVEGLAADTAVGTVAVPWMPAVKVKTISAMPAQTLWAGSPLKREVTARAATSGQVGQIKIGRQTTNLTLEKPIPKPSIFWRLTHPAKILKKIK